MIAGAHAMEKNVNPHDQTPSGKKLYTTPRLIEYGSIAKLTQGGGSVTADGGALMNCL